MNQILELFFAIIVSIALGYTCFTMTIDPQWGGFCSFSVLSLYILSKLLKINKYLEFVVTFAITVALTVAFLIYKINVTDAFKSSNVAVSNSYFNRFKENTTGNDALFFWAMFTASAITVLGILLAKNIYNKMKKTGGLQGEPGPQGPRGEQGESSAFLNATNEIALKNIIQKVNKQIEKHMNDSPKPIQYREGDEHLRNYWFKTNLKRILYSQDFNKMYIDTLYSNDMENLSVSNRKCARENVALQHTINLVGLDVEKWVEFILSYSHGLKFLRGELSIERDWDVLYINRDKRNGLPPNPIQQLREGIPALEFSLEENKWNWGNCKV